MEKKPTANVTTTGHSQADERQVPTQDHEQHGKQRHAHHYERRLDDVAVERRPDLFDILFYSALEIARSGRARPPQGSREVAVTQPQRHPGQHPVPRRPLDDHGRRLSRIHQAKRTEEPGQKIGATGYHDLIDELAKQQRRDERQRHQQRPHHNQGRARSAQRAHVALDGEEQVGGAP